MHIASKPEAKVPVASEANQAQNYYISGQTKSRFVRDEPEFYLKMEAKVKFLEINFEVNRWRLKAALSRIEIVNLCI